ncbi:hypothetical protein FRB96_000973 [Tulasnella sp. 330]|nr:hypothetical protein FRB96_000973 [Tulasnella sp. 330]KAG8881895.1 hypothetical protein FRB97_008942 [Tulasnella sp. 331]KAG8887860.1 hypothetical protein FRB98_008826 [Tulasnella sp. 332]
MPGINRTGHATTYFIKVSKGIDIQYSLNKPKGSRLVSWGVGQSSVPPPPADMDELYTLTTANYIADRGDFLIHQGPKFETLDQLDVVPARHISEHSLYRSSYHRSDVNE